MLSTFLLTGSTLLVFKIYSSFDSKIIYRFFKGKKVQNHKSQMLASSLHASKKEKVQEIDQGLAISSLSLGFATAGALVYAPLSVTAIPGLLYLSVPLGKDAYESLKNDGQLNQAFLDLFVLASCLTLRYYLAASLLLCSSYLCRRFWLQEELSTHQSLSDMAKNACRVAWLLKEDVEVEVSSDKLQVGDVVVVYPGELVAADGTIMEGMGLIDERFLTSDSSPLTKERGEKVLLGTLLLAGRITVQIESVYCPHRFSHIQRPSA